MYGRQSENRWVNQEISWWIKNERRVIKKVWRRKKNNERKIKWNWAVKITIRQRKRNDGEQILRELKNVARS